MRSGPLPAILPPHMKEGISISRLSPVILRLTGVAAGRIISPGL
ncbi:MAG: hypothetical protein AVDCRST_MAG05-4573 [uncultured Rubrobacteraceae bacterium]|uniref:Uncharacterized protein n=1 Tax=uncultured Rubrobacteraceae bacterium TaxID=349277 RepID=A0A6J4TVI9_9ACTN|nr:MAG: hypothetical protein AVDCRST_MAG05-4573 [uncultured Rubrobacteraceae bacterium]